jgi:hypothetical protein
MTQLSLFPPPAAISKPLPDDVLRAARDLLAEMLKAVIEEITQEFPTEQGDTDV